jgi:hypothetical protein
MAACQIIRELNARMAATGTLTLAGKVDLNCFDACISGSYGHSSPQHIPDSFSAAFSPTLDTTAFDRSILGRFEASACTAASVGLPPSPVQHGIPPFFEVPTWRTGRTILCHQNIVNRKMPCH